MKSRSRLASDSVGNVILPHIPTLFMTSLIETCCTGNDATHGRVFTTFKHRPLTPFTAPACESSGLKGARAHLQTVYLSVLLHFYFQYCYTSTFNTVTLLLSVLLHFYFQYCYTSTFNTVTLLLSILLHFYFQYRAF